MSARVRWFRCLLIAALALVVHRAWLDGTAQLSSSSSAPCNVVHAPGSEGTATRQCQQAAAGGMLYEYAHAMDTLAADKAHDTTGTSAHQRQRRSPQDIDNGDVTGPEQPSPTPPPPEPSPPEPSPPPASSSSTRRPTYTFTVDTPESVNRVLLSGGNSGGRANGMGLLFAIGGAVAIALL